jgi:cyclase
VEKLCLQSAFFERPETVREIADFAGAQAVVVSIDVVTDRKGKRRLRSPALGRAGFETWQEAMKAAERFGAGEILLTDADRDGTFQGLDLGLVSEASALVEVPLIAAGGANSLDGIRRAVEAGASAVAAGAFFVFYGPHRAVLITYPRYEELMALWKAV